MPTGQHYLTPRGVELRTRIGIATGLVVVGDIDLAAQRSLRDTAHARSRCRSGKGLR